jgi:UPF0755 protein
VSGGKVRGVGMNMRRKGREGEARSARPAGHASDGALTTVPARSQAVTSAPKRAAKRPDDSSREPRTLSPVLRLLNATLTFLVALSIAIGGGLFYLHSGLDAPGPLEQPRTIAIPRNDGTLNIAERLEREGVIANRYTFLISYWLLGRQADWNGGKQIALKAGEYEVKPNASVRSVIETLSEGRTVQFKITIPEGLTSAQIVDRLKADPNLSGDLREVPPEGSLLPETYSVGRGTPRIQVIQMMQAARTKLMDQLWSQRAEGLPFKTAEEALILASIVEKETGRNDERDRVAGVFVNRLRLKMRLESDPTILYGLHLGKVQWGRPILRSEIRSNTAHNTYVIPALPPTAICNPGRAAIEATLRPASTKELFFVANGKGGHVFTETLKDHEAHVRNLRRMEAEAAAAKAAQPAQPAPAPVVQPTTINARPPSGAASAAPQAAAPASAPSPVKKN